MRTTKKVAVVPVKKPRKVRKDKKSEEQRALEKEQKAQAKFDEKWKEKIAQEDLQGVERAKKEKLPDVHFDLEEFIPETYVLVLTPQGNIYNEPVPRYCAFNSFLNFLATCRDIPEDKTFNLRAEVSTTAFPSGVITTGYYDGSRQSNNYAMCFEIKNRTKIVGGNIVFSKEEKGYTKRELKKVVDWIVSQLEGEIICQE